MGTIDESLLKRIDDSRFGRNRFSRDGGDTTGGGEPPGGGQLEKRVAELEKASQDIRERLIRIDGKLDLIEKTMATEITLAEVRTELARETGSILKTLSDETGTINQSVANFRTEITRIEGNMIKWYIVTAIALTSIVGTIAFGIARSIPR